jgi:hypothetical protein
MTYEMNRVHVNDLDSTDITLKLCRRDRMNFNPFSGKIVNKSSVLFNNFIACFALGLFGMLGLRTIHRGY